MTTKLEVIALGKPIYNMQSFNCVWSEITIMNKTK